MHSLTPQRSLQARLAIEILKGGVHSKFVRTAAGRFFLRDLFDAAQRIKAGEAPFQNSLGDLSVYDSPRRAPAPSAEKVLAIPRTHFNKVLNFQGFRTDNGRLLNKLVKGPVTYLARTAAEGTEDYKHVVTYVVVTHKSKVLAFTRGVFNRAAEFLRGSSCIGFGGHVSEQDLTLFSLPDAGVTENALRELQEEISLARVLSSAEISRIKVAGIINDDSSDVGRRHVAVVLRYEISDALAREARRGEASINQLRWIDTRRETVNLADFEYWSQLCWRHFFPDVVRAQPAFRILRKRQFQQAHILVIIGSIGSGKSLVTRFFTEQLGYEDVNSGKVLAKLLGVPPVPKTSRTKFQELAATFIASTRNTKQFGRALVSAATTGHKTHRIVLDGIRHRTTLNAIREATDLPIAVLFVHASPDLAYQLYLKREYEGTKPLTVTSFMAMLNGPSERDIPHLFGDADVVLYNWSGQKELHTALSRLANELGLRKRKFPKPLKAATEKNKERRNRNAGRRIR